MGQNEKTPASNTGAIETVYLLPAPLTVKDSARKMTKFVDTNIPDSLQYHKVRKWILWRMIHEVEQGRVCDSLQRFQADVIQKDSKLIQAQDSLLEVRKREILALNGALSTTNNLYLNEVGRYRIEKKQTRKWKVISFFSAGVLIAHIIFHP